MIQAQLNREIGAFAAAMDELYGHYLDSINGFQKIHQFIVDGQKEAKRLLPPGIDLDSRELIIGCGDPADPSHFIQHRTTQGQFKNRNARGGQNCIRAAQLLIVLIYSFWETRYRSSIAAALGLKDTSALKVPLVGDLRLLRNDIVPCSGRIQKETAAKLEIMTHFKEGDEIVLKEDAVHTLVQDLKAALDSLVVHAGGVDPHHRTVWQIHGGTVRPKTEIYETDL